MKYGRFGEDMGIAGVSGRFEGFKNEEGYSVFGTLNLQIPFNKQGTANLDDLSLRAGGYWNFMGSKPGNAFSKEPGYSQMGAGIEAFLSETELRAVKNGVRGLVSTLAVTSLAMEPFKSVFYQFSAGGGVAEMNSHSNLINIDKILVPVISARLSVISFRGGASLRGRICIFPGGNDLGDASGMESEIELTKSFKPFPSLGLLTASVGYHHFSVYDGTSTITVQQSENSTVTNETSNENVVDKVYLRFGVGL
jgi:hypothetical protein